MEDSEKYQHPLRCSECGYFMFLVIKYVRFEKDKKGIDCNVPFFECSNCGHSKPLRPRKEWEKIAENDRKSLQEEEFVRMVFAYEEKQFKHYDHLGFKYDSTDYYLIPGLSREWDDGYLTPVFFGRDILIYYNAHPDYSVRLYSFSSGNIYHKGEAMFNWGFGINRNGKIFKWLGDLNEDFEEEHMLPHLKRFQASNIDSDHDIVSKFYFSQIPFSPSDAFQDSDNEYRLLKLKNKFEEKVQKAFGFKMSKLDVEHLSDYYKHPILEERDQIFSAYISLNKYLIENIEQDELKKVLVQKGLSKKDLKGLRSLKLFEHFITSVLSLENASSIIAPLYVLYDLRQLHGHLVDKSFTERYDFCKERLKIDISSSDLETFKILVKSLIGFYEQLGQSLSD